MTRVLVFGTYDLLHKGHKFFLEQAAARGSSLSVVVSRDQTVRALKKRLPVHDECARKRALERVAVVDEVLLGSLGDKYAVIERVSPDVIVLGYDQRFFVDSLESELAQRGVSCVVERVSKSFKPDVYKSSLLRAQKK